MKKKSQKSAKFRRTASKYRVILIIIFAVTASYAAISVLAFGPSPVFKPPTGSPSPSPSPPSTQPNGSGSTENTPAGGSNPSANQPAASAGEQRNQTTSCSSSETDLKNNCIIKDVQQIVNFLSAGVAIIVVAVIVVGGIQYIAAGNSPEATVKARQRITNGLIALVAFMLIWAFLQWLIPGGVFG